MIILQRSVSLYSNFLETYIDRIGSPREREEFEGEWEVVLNTVELWFWDGVRGGGLPLVGWGLDLGTGVDISICSM